MSPTASTSHSFQPRTHFLTRTTHAVPVRTQWRVTSIEYACASRVHYILSRACFSVVFLHRFHSICDRLRQQGNPFFITPLIKRCDRFTSGQFSVRVIVRRHTDERRQRQHPSSAAHLNIFQLILIGVEEICRQVTAHRTNTAKHNQNHYRWHISLRQSFWHADLSSPHLRRVPSLCFNEWTRKKLTRAEETQKRNTEKSEKWRKNRTLIEIRWNKGIARVGAANERRGEQIYSAQVTELIFSIITKANVEKKTEIFPKENELCKMAKDQRQSARPSLMSPLRLPPKKCCFFIFLPVIWIVSTSCMES